MATGHTAAPSPLDAVAAMTSAAGSSPAPTSAADPILLSVAPMMEWTNRNYRYLARLLTRHTLMYTEMLVDITLIHAKLAKGYLRFHPSEHPIACQLGGSNPDTLRVAARMVADAGYDEINLNCGCPSDRVAGAGLFGARLMFSPERVRDCVAAMRSEVNIPISVKCRLGADNMDTYEEFANFLHIVSQGGCSHFIVHARKCVLNGLSPKDNRTIPPLRYHWVQRAALEFPHLRISLNGGVQDLAGAAQLLALRRGPDYVLPSEPAWLHARRTPAPPESPDAVPRGGSATPASEADSPRPSSDASNAASPRGGAAESAVPSCCKPEDDEASPPDGDAGDGDSASDGSDADDNRSQQPAVGTVAYARMHRRTAKAKAAKLSGSAAAALAKRGADDGFPSDPLAQLWPGSVRGEEAPVEFGRAPNLLESVMIGRAAYNNLWILSDADRRIFGKPNPGLSRREVVMAYLDYADTLCDGVPEEELVLHYYRASELIKPLLGMFVGCRGAAKFRNALTQHPGMARMMPHELRPVMLEALELLPDEFLDERPPV